MKTGVCLLAVLCLSCSALAQQATIRGRVSDESGAVVPGASVTLHGPSGFQREAAAAADGSYSFGGLQPGEYALQASAPDLVLPQPVKITLGPGLQTVNLQLKIATTVQQVVVEENAGRTVTPEASNNASALVLGSNDLQALADDPDDLQADLQALAGPAAGPNGGSMFIDGFSTGQLPSKDSIREIRINQNPFSPEYDKLGLGRIEIFTKPGTDKFHGTGFYNFGDSIWNSRDPYAAEKAPFLLKEYGGNISGPLNRKASFFLDIQRHAIDNGAIINTVTLDPATLTANPFTQVFRTPQRRIVITPRLDYQINAGNTLSVRYGYTTAKIQDAGIGSFNLVSRAYGTHFASQTAQITETAVLATSVVNEVRFQFFRTDASTAANSPNPAVLVLGSFSGGGAQIGNPSDLQDNYELQNYTTITHGGHVVRFGARLRELTDRNMTGANFGGTFIFGGGIGPALDGNNQPVLDASGQPVLEPITSIERYRRTLLFEQAGFAPAQIRALGGGATQFTLDAGNPLLSASQFDAGAFVGDDWRARPNLTLSLGLRYEAQTNLQDRRDFAPRLGVAWAPGGKSSKNVIRGGFGIFYDRFALGNTVAARRYNGIVQQQYVLNNPDFYPLVPPPSALGGYQIIQQISGTLRAPYVMQSAAGWERQLPYHTTLAVNYANSHGLHQLRSEDINAPLPGTFNPSIPGSGVFPRGNPNPVFLMESSGLYNQNQLLVNVNSQMSKSVSLFGSYVLNYARSNTDGLSTFPANPYSFAGEYGPAATDVRHHASLGGSVIAKWKIRFNPLLIINSGPPFDVTAGSDIYGTTMFNARPGIPADLSKPGLIQTRYGLLDPAPGPGEPILPRNFGRGPGSILMNLRINRTFAFGPARDNSQPATASSERRYNLSVSLSIRNLINHTNPGPIIGDVTSPLFGQSNQTFGATSLGGTNFLESANNRRLEFQGRFTF